MCTNYLCKIWKILRNSNHIWLQSPKEDIVYLYEIPLYCFKPSVTRKSAPLYLKTQIKSQQYVRQQIMKLVITFSSLLNPMQLISFFVVLAQWPITSVKAIISKKLIKFLWMSVRPVPQSRCPDHWRLWEAHFNHFFYSEILILKPGKALSNKKWGLSGSQEKPSGHLGPLIAPTVWFIAIFNPF